MAFSNHLDELSETLGGCGLFQWLVCLIIHGAAIVWNWSMVQMSYIGQDVKFWCRTLRVDLQDLRYLNLTTVTVDGLCHVDKYATCRSFVFHDNMGTAVSEWALVCDRKWGIAVITTLQMVGILVGNLCAGQSADTFGRKPTISLGLFICIIFNFIGYFTLSWEFYAFVCLLIGFGTGIALTIQFPLLIEYVPAWMRSWVISVPCEPICGCLFALACWLLNDWRKVHLFTACFGLPFAFALLFIPESSRWLVTKRKFKEATQVVSIIAKINRVAQPDLAKIFEASDSEIGTDDKTTVHTLTSLFKSVDMCSTTLRLSFLWFVNCCSWFGLTLGVKGLSTSIYSGIFLINAVDIISFSATGPCVDRFGRKRFLIAVYIIAGLVGCISGCLQNLILRQKLFMYFVSIWTWSSYLSNYVVRAVFNIAVDLLDHNVFHNLQSVYYVQGVWPTLIALAGKAACTLAFVGVIIYTSEMYPTEIRTIGYGFSSAVGRIGTVVAPNVILLDDYVHGVLYFSSGLLMFVCAIVILPMRETKNTVLKDTITQIEVDQS